jgi:hypothetical protein
MEENHQWFLMKHDDGSVFGPVPFDQLRQWAEDAQISPLDKLSQDESTWIKAPMVPDLNMDFLVEVSSDQYYGPTTLGAVREFLLIGEITADTYLTNCKDGIQVRVSDMPELLPRREEEQPVRTSIRLSLQKRIRELEEALMDERRALEAAELRCERLEARLAEVASKNY